MSKFSAFMKKNQVARENKKYAATKSLCDENGQPLEWELKPLTTKENDGMRETCTRDVPVVGKRGQYTQKLDTSRYIAKLITASVVDPNLNDKELQDSYGVMTPEELLKEMINNPAEYSELSSVVQELCGFTSLDDEVEQAKN